MITSLHVASITYNIYIFYILCLCLLVVKLTDVIGAGMIAGSLSFGKAAIALHSGICSCVLSALHMARLLKKDT